MKRYLLFVFIIITGLGCTAKSSAKDKMVTAQEEQVQVLYFHLTRRCATCMAVENVSRNYIEKVYGDRVKFESYNLDEQKAREIAEKHKVSGQALIIVSGDTRYDITAKAFMNALKNPEKLEELLKQNVDPLIIKE